MFFFLLIWTCHSFSNLSASQIHFSGLSHKWFESNGLSRKWSEYQKDWCGNILSMKCLEYLSPEYQMTCSQHSSIISIPDPGTLQEEQHRVTPVLPLPPHPCSTITSGVSCGRRFSTLWAAKWSIGQDRVCDGAAVYWDLSSIIRCSEWGFIKAHRTLASFCLESRVNLSCVVFVHFRNKTQGVNLYCFVFLLSLSLY